MSYPLDAVAREVAFLAVHLHWSREALLGLCHPERQRWVREVEAVHARLREEG